MRQGYITEEGNKADRGEVVKNRCTFTGYLCWVPGGGSGGEAGMQLKHRAPE